MKFCEVLTDLMQEKNIDIKMLASATNIKLGSLYFYFKNETLPDINCAIKLSEYFNCSISYLLGLSEKKDIKLKKTDKSFIENYTLLLKENKTNNFRVCNDIGISRNSICNWRKGQTPKMMNLVEISKYFDTNIDFLLGRTDIR